MTNMIGPTYTHHHITTGYIYYPSLFEKEFPRPYNPSIFYIIYSTYKTNKQNKQKKG